MKEYIDAKCNVFTEHMQVPDELKPEFKNLCDEMYALGENCNDCYQYEEKFLSSGLSERYNSLLAKCIPKAVKMTKKQKKAAVKMTLDQISAKEIASDIADMATTELQSEAIRMKREKMIEEGVFDDYTRARNKAENAGRVGKFMLGKLGRK